MFSHHVEGYVLMFSRLLGGIIGIEYMPRSVTGDQGYLGESDGIDARQGLFVLPGSSSWNEIHASYDGREHGAEKCV